MYVCMYGGTCIIIVAYHTYVWAELGPSYFSLVKHYVIRYFMVSERSEQDTIRGVQIRASAVYIYIYVHRCTCAIVVAACQRIQNVGRVRPLPF